MMSSSPHPAKAHRPPFVVIARKPEFADVLECGVVFDVQKHIYERVTARELAEQAGISPEYLSTLFSEHMKCSIPQYIARQKILEAKKLLRFTEKPLSEIAALLNFSSQSYFQAQFKKIRGITPAAYREKYRKGARR